MSILDDNLHHLDSTSQFSTKSKKASFLAKLGMQKMVAIGVVALIVVALPVAVLLVQRNQDIQQRASTPTGQAVLTGRSAAPLIVGQPANIILSLNTNSVQILGTQLEFTIDTSQTSALGAAPTVQQVSGSGLNIYGITVNQNPNGSYTVTFVAISTSPTQPFSSTGPVDFATIVFTPTGTGNVTFQYNQTTSQVNMYDSEDNEDTLLTVPNMSFAIAAPSATFTPTLTATNTPIFTNTPTRTPTLTFTPTNTFTPSPSATNGPTATPTLTRTPTPSRTPTYTPSITPTRTPTNSPVATATSTTAPTSTPVTGVCTSISISYVSNNQPVYSPKLNDQVQFTCGQIAGAVRYQFKVKTPGSATYGPAMEAISAGSRISQPVTLSLPGDYSAQCRMCVGATDDTCMAWETP